MLLGFILSILSILAGELIGAKSIKKCMEKYRDELQRKVPGNVISLDLDPTVSPKSWVERSAVRAALLPALCLTLIGFFEINVPSVESTYMDSGVIVVTAVLAIGIWRFGELDSESRWTKKLFGVLSKPAALLIAINVILIFAALVWD